jgi:hypothetical protein
VFALYKIHLKDPICLLLPSASRFSHTYFRKRAVVPVMVWLSSIKPEEQVGYPSVLPASTSRIFQNLKHQLTMKCPRCPKNYFSSMNVCISLLLQNHSVLKCFYPSVYRVSALPKIRSTPTYVRVSGCSENFTASCGWIVGAYFLKRRVYKVFWGLWTLSFVSHSNLSTFQNARESLKCQRSSEFKDELLRCPYISKGNDI